MLTVAQLVNEFPTFMKPEGSLPCTKERASLMLLQQPVTNFELLNKYDQGTFIYCCGTSVKYFST
jgi:hypothetical protein